MSILVATDFSENAAEALRVASAEARRRQTTLTVLHCVDSISEKWEYLDETKPDARDRVTTAAHDHLVESYNQAVPREDQPKVDDFVVYEGHAAEGIVETAEQGDYDLLIVGSTGGGALARMMLGSTAEEVVRTSKLPVLVVPKKGLGPIEDIVAPVDLSACSEASLVAAAERAKAEAATLGILHVSTLPAGAMTLMEWEPSEDDREAHREFRSRQMERFLEELDLEEVEYDTLLRFGAPHRLIVEVARERESDLIVMGTHGRRGFERFFLGSTASKVLRRMPCPVLAIPYKEE